MWNWIRKSWDRLTSPRVGGLQKSGNWRVRYPDNDCTVWLDYATASNLKDIYGGKLEHKTDVKKKPTQ